MQHVAGILADAQPAAVETPRSPTHVSIRKRRRVSSNPPLLVQGSYTDARKRRNKCALGARSRWLPYIRRNTLNQPATFFYGKEPASGPTDTIAVGPRLHVRVECKAEAGTPVINMSYARMGEAALTERTLSGGAAGDLVSLPMPGIKQTLALGACDKITMRRVVGIAQSAPYAGADFHRLGSVLLSSRRRTSGRAS